MDGSRHHSGDVAKMPRMSSGLRCDWDRSRAFGVNRNVSADASCIPMCGVADLPCGEACAPPNRIHIPNERNSTMKACERDGSKDTEGKTHLLDLLPNQAELISLAR